MWAGGPPQWAQRTSVRVAAKEVSSTRRALSAGVAGEKEGQAQAGGEFGIGDEEFRAAGGADVGAFFGEVVIFACAGAFGGFFAEGGVLLRREDFFPFVIGFGDGESGEGVGGFHDGFLGLVDRISGLA